MSGVTRIILRRWRNNVPIRLLINTANSLESIEMETFGCGWNLNHRGSLRSLMEPLTLNNRIVGTGTTYLNINLIEDIR